MTTGAASADMGWMYWAGELLAAGAYSLVAVLLFFLGAKRDEWPRRLLFFLFGVLATMGSSVHFINLLGTQEWLGVLLVVKLFFGLIAVVAAFLLFKAIPGVLAIPSTKKLEKANADLQALVLDRERIEHDLKETQAELERRVRERSNQLTKANRDLEREVENRKSTEKQLIAKNYELVRINADLDDFVYYASRDLKGPVLNVAGLVDALREDLPAGNPEFAQLFSRLDGAVAQINQKLNNLAEVSRIQRPAEEAQQTTVAFDEVLAQVKGDLTEALQISQAQIITDFSAAPTLSYSKENLRSLLFHLLSNSLKYRDPERPLTVTLKTEVQEKFVRLTVQDNGIGMDLSRHEQQLFSLFRRFHDHVEGSGLGLYIIKRIIDNNRGKVEVQSTLGQGTTFFLYFVNHQIETGTTV
ncbi:ATP-binding protein [Rufibacter sp. LB8]|nr:HAMP domain-containing sensor histidine kinase [Rufibacter sp. LB8]